MNDNVYAIIWYEDDTIYRLVNTGGELKTFTRQQAETEASVAGFLNTEEDINSAEDDLRYAISLQLLEETYGYGATT